jgi:hypothetical protein
MSEDIPFSLENGGLGDGIGIIDPLNDQRWDRFVERHPFGWITHLSGWKRVLDECFSHMHGYYLTLSDSAGDLKAALPIYSVDSWLTGRRLVSIPFATLSDPLSSTPEDMERLLCAAITLSKYLNTTHIVIKTVSTSPLLNWEKYAPDCHNKQHSIHLCKDPDLIKESFHRTCVRQRIKRAQESGLRIVSGSTDADLQKFYDLHCMTRKRCSLPPQPYPFIRSIWQAFAGSKRVELLLAYKEDVAVAGIILFKYKNRVSVEFLAVDAAYHNLSPVHLLFWSSIRDACLAGYGVLDFGSTSIHNKTLMNFKSHWGTQVTDLPHFFYPNVPTHSLKLKEDSAVQKALRYVCNNAPDCILHCIGDFCYRHLG